jgi:hypothetical protein
LIPSQAWSLEKKEILNRASRNSRPGRGRFGATVALIANGDNEEVIRNFQALVCESFRFEVKELEERATRFLAFEKSPGIPDQPIEVDPSRGVFLLSRAETSQFPSPLGQSAKQAARADSIEPALRSLHHPSPLRSPATPVRAADQKRNHILASKTQNCWPNLWSTRENADELSQPGTDALPSEATFSNDVSPTVADHGRHLPFEPNGANPTHEPIVEMRADPLSDLLDDLAGAASPLDLDALDAEYFELDVARQRAEPARVASTQNQIPTEVQFLQ